jgi:DNA repair protein RadC
LSCQSLFRGGITGTVTDVRIVLKCAIEFGATAMIVAHNHPSGALKPSENDKRMTKKLNEACLTLDLNLLDHLIVARSGYFSFSDQGLL